MSILLFEKIFYGIVTMLGIITQFSGTGFVMLVVILFFFATCIVKRKSVVLLRAFVYSLTFVIISVMICFSIMYKKEPELVNSAMGVITNRISYIVGDKYIKTDWEGVNITYDTIEMRKNQLEESKTKYLTSLNSYIFGVGFDNITIDGDTKMKS